jgi:hypothetical protein
MQRYESKYVVCPFYHNEEALVLYCEGVIKDSTLLNAFRRSADKREYKGCYCTSMEGHKKCPYAEILYKKYEDGGI